MELTQHQHGFLEELLITPRNDNWTNFNNGINDLFPNDYNFGSLDDEDDPISSSTLNSSFLELISAPQHPTEPNFQFLFTHDIHHQEPYYPFLDSFTLPQVQQNPVQENTYPSVFEDKDPNFITDNHQNSVDESKSSSSCKLETNQSNPNLNLDYEQDFEMGFCEEKKNKKSKRVEGQPSKNLMAERRRRKRLNDRLSMLRSIVPKISKMDRTSILGDAIDYVKELLEKIHKFEEEEQQESGSTSTTTPATKEVKLISDVNEVKPNKVLVRNSPKFDVERRNTDTQVEICCATKPGLLLTTVNTLEALGLEIQQCVISSFGDFSMQASCSEVGEQGGIVSCEDIKQALYRNAGYGGRCL